MAVDIIAEIGVNHQNNIALAEAMINEAALHGATTIKFQASTVREEVSFTAAPEHFHELALLVPATQFLRQAAFLCRQAGVEFLCTPAGPESLETVMDLGVRRIKVASDNLTNLPFLKLVRGTALPILLSTGMGTIGEVEEAMDVLTGGSYPADITLLHCVSAYPAPIDQTNLLAMLTMHKHFGYPVGFSDHSTSVMLPATSVMLGASVIEKHVTVSKSMAGPDHAASLSMPEFRLMVSYIREAEAALGTGDKVPQPCELMGIQRYRKSIVALRDIAPGEVLTEENVTAKRPGTGHSIADWYAVRGTVTKRGYKTDDLIE